MKKKLKIILIAVLVASIAVCCFIVYACSSKKDTEDNALKLSFKSASGYDYLKTIDGETVTINGYMATSSPVDGSFIFLMNLPYQSCPFCVPNTSQLSNTMEIYPKKGEKFGYTNQAIKVIGTLVVSESVDKPFTDQYGYEFNFKIVNAKYTILKAEDISNELALWQKIASTDIINELYRMFDYVNFCCKWNTYYVNSYVNADGEYVAGYYLYASDAKYYITHEGAQWNYGYQEGYFENIINQIEKVDETAFADLVECVEKAKALSLKAIGELEAGNYTYENIYVEKFDTYDDVYTLNIGEELAEEMDTIYLEFSNWIGSWEM